eukprot:COSAG01_NODE_14235_length_1479_cov_2.284783_2_plen_258_part_00
MAEGRRLDAEEFFAACDDGRIDDVKAHDAAGGDLNLRCLINMTGLMAAAHQGHMDVVAWLVQASGIEVDAQDDIGQTALHLAASQGHADCARWLLEGGADPLIKSTGAVSTTPLQQAKLSAVLGGGMGSTRRASVWDVFQQHAAKAPAPQPQPDPQPQPKPKPQPPAVDAWLATIGLPQYAPQIKEYGYDRITVLYDATEADIVEMTEDANVKMKKPHRRTFVARWKELLASAVASASAGGGDLPEPEPEPEPGGAG